MPTTILANIFDAIILTASFLIMALLIDPEWQNVTIAIGGAFSGAFILAYFRRDPSKVEQIYKVLCASISGLVIGSAAHLYLGWSDVRAVLLIYFLSALLSLTLLQALYNMTDKNAMEIVRAAGQRFFGLKPADTTHHRRKRRQVSPQRRGDAEDAGRDRED